MENKIFILLILSIFFDAYAITYIRTYPITLFTIIAVIYMGCSIFDILVKRAGKLKVNISTEYAVLMIIYIFLNYVLTGAKNVNSLLLAEFFWIIFIFNNRVESNEYFKRYLSLFVAVMNVLAIYGIYQFMARWFGLPFGDLKIEGHMVTGFNWSNQVSFLGRFYYRSNAIFREPSFFSQYLAVNIFLQIVEWFQAKNIKVKKLIFVIINVAALLLTFSGTGIMLLIMSLSIYFFRAIIIKRERRRTISKRIWGFVITAVITLCVVINTPVGEYLLGRLSELFTYSENAFSGYVRFRSGADVLRAAWGKNFFLGRGIGTVDEFILSMRNYYLGMTVNGFYRPAVELGAIGQILWLFFIGSIYKRTNNRDKLALGCILFPMMFCHDVFMSNYYWIFLYLLGNYGHSTMISCVGWQNSCSDLSGVGGVYVLTGRLQNWNEGQKWEK